MCADPVSCYELIPYLPLLELQLPCYYISRQMLPGIHYLLTLYMTRYRFLPLFQNFLKKKLQELEQVLKMLEQG